LQHAIAERLEMALTYKNEGVTMIIRDDGIGFDQEQAEATGTIGITNMHQRAVLLNGTLDIKTLTGKGTCITLNIHHVKKQT